MMSPHWAACFGVECLLGQQTGEAGEGTQRSPYLMAHVGEEKTFGLHGILGVES